ncbi:hypothetical protein GCU69_30280, partial [Streptomyces lycii]
RERGRPEGEGWEPVPVPLPTYVTAPVAPRATGGVDLDAPDAWSSARSGTAGPAAEATGTDRPAGTQQPERPGKRTAQDPAPRTGRTERARRGRDRDRTPLFDQYEGDDRPRAANE